MGRENVFNVTAKIWRVPDSLDCTNHEAPGPMWHCTQPTLARARLERQVLRFHDFVAHRAAELGRVHVVQPRYAAKHDDDVHERQHQDEGGDPAVAGRIEVQRGPQQFRLPAARRRCCRQTPMGMRISPR